MGAHNSNVGRQFREKSWTFVAVKLNGVEADVIDKLIDLTRVVIYEDAHFHDIGRQSLGDVLRDARSHNPPTFAKEIKAQRAGSRVGRRACVVVIGDAADFDPERHTFIIGRISRCGLA
jgi:hypothetical protein